MGDAFLGEPTSVLLALDRAFFFRSLISKLVFYLHFFTFFGLVLFPHLPRLSFFI